LSFFRQSWFSLASVRDRVYRHAFQGHFHMRKFGLVALLFVLLMPCFAGNNNDSWKPVAADELTMKDASFAPGAHAVVLDWDTFTDDEHALEKVYYRVKILSDEGKSNANIEIPYLKELFNIKDIQART